MELTQPVGGILPGPTLDKSLDDDTNEIYPKTPLTDRTRRISIPMDLTQPIGGILSNGTINTNQIVLLRQGIRYVLLLSW
jgi:hypothetical protein